MNRQRLPNRRSGIRVTIGTGPNRLTLSTGEYPDGRLGEIFLDHQKEGTGHRSQKSPLSGATRWEAQGRALGTGRLLGPALGLLASCRLRPSGARCWCRSGGPRRPASLLQGTTGRGGLRASGAPAQSRGSARARGEWWGGALVGRWEAELIPVALGSGLDISQDAVQSVLANHPRQVVGDCDIQRVLGIRPVVAEAISGPALVVGLIAGQPNLSRGVFAVIPANLNACAAVDGHFSSCGWGSSPDTTSIGPLARNARGKARNIFRNSQVVQMEHMEFPSVMEVTA